MSDDTDMELVTGYAIETGIDKPKDKPKPKLVDDDGKPTVAGWHYIQARLSETMDFQLRDGRGGQKFKYIDARQVQDRLDEVVGPGNWSTKFKVLYHDPERNNVVVECQLTIFGVTKADTGSNNAPDIDRFVPAKQGDYGSFTDSDGKLVKRNGSWEDQPFKAAYSDAIKRAAVSWSIGRFLYD